MAFPTVPVVDDFNRANGTAGSSWSKDTFAAGSGTAAIASNEFSENSTGYVEYWYNVASYANTNGLECENRVGTALATKAAVSSLNGDWVTLCQQPGSAACDAYQVGAIRVTGTNTDRVHGYRYDNAVPVKIIDVALGRDWVAGTDKIGLEVTLSGAINAYVNGTLIGTATDLTYFHAGQSAFGGVALSGTGNPSLDDFRVGQTVGGGPITTPITLTANSVGAAALSRVAARLLVAIAASIPARVAVLRRSLTTTTSGSAARTITLDRTVTVTATGAASKATQAARQFTASSAGIPSRRIAVARTLVSPSVAALTRTIALTKALAAASSGAASQTALKVILRTMSVTGTATATLRRTSGMQRIAVASATTATPRRVALARTVLSSGQASALRSVAKKLGALAVSMAGLARSVLPGGGTPPPGQVALVLTEVTDLGLRLNQATMLDLHLGEATLLTLDHREV